MCRRISRRSADDATKPSAAAAPYFRVFNPTTQARKFDPEGTYVRRWVPEVDDGDYPEPIIDHAAERKEALRRYSAIS
jgi:deoxyribodipyrimidine photo-lyase